MHEFTTKTINCSYKEACALPSDHCTCSYLPGCKTLAIEFVIGWDVGALVPLSMSVD